MNSNASLTFENQTHIGGIKTVLSLNAYFAVAEMSGMAARDVAMTLEIHERQRVA